MVLPVNSTTVSSNQALSKQEASSWKGRVVVLAGGSSAGKSTIIQALKILQKGMVEEGSDLTGANLMYEFMERNYRKFGVTQQDWEHLHTVLNPRKNNWHIHDAVSRDMNAKASAYDFKKGTPVVDQERAMKTAKALYNPITEYVMKTEKLIDNIVMDKVLEHTQKGTDVAFDILHVEKINDHALNQQAQIKKVLIFCPFGKLTERLAERNRKAINGETDLSEVRAGVFPLLQYSELVRARQPNDKDSDVIDKVTKEAVEKDFDQTFNDSIEVMKLTEDGRANLQSMEKELGGLSGKKDREKKMLLKALGFAESDPPGKSIELVSRKKYDLRIDTSDPTLGKSIVERANAAAKKILGL